MKVTKEQLIEAFNKTAEKEVLNFNDKVDSLKLVLEDSKMTPGQFENVVGWLTEIGFFGENQILINSDTSLTGIIFLENTLSHAKKLNLNNARLYDSYIEGSGQCVITDSKIQRSAIDINKLIGSKVIIRYSEIIVCNIVDSFIEHSFVIGKDNEGGVLLANSHVTHSRLCIPAADISNKTFSSVIIDADKFGGDYFSIGLNGESAVGYINGTEKVIVVGEKKYNLGLWEEQFVNKEQNLFIKMMNQKKLEMINMFFDSLAFK